MKLDSKSKDILKFRPTIDFVEPDQEPSFPNPIEVPPDPKSIDEMKEERLKIARYARSVVTLAKVVQGLIDKEAANVTIKLDPGVDAAAVQAMTRTYGVSNEITYDHFKQCEESLRKHNEKTAKKATISQDQIDDAREAILSGKNISIGGLGTLEASNGGLRPELDKRNQIVEPIDLDEFQDNLLKMLMNLLWKNFLRKILTAVIPFPLTSLIPEDLPPLSEAEKKRTKDIKDDTKEASEAGGEPEEPKVEDYLK